MAKEEPMSPTSPADREPLSPTSPADRLPDETGWVVTPTELAESPETLCRKGSPTFSDGDNLTVGDRTILPTVVPTIVPTMVPTMVPEVMDASDEKPVQLSAGGSSSSHVMDVTVGQGEPQAEPVPQGTLTIGQVQPQAEAPAPVGQAQPQAGQAPQQAGEALRQELTQEQENRRRIGHQHRLQNKFIPDPNDPHQLRYRRQKDLKNQREARRKANRLAGVPPRRWGCANMPWNIFQHTWWKQVCVGRCLGREWRSLLVWKCW